MINSLVLLLLATSARQAPIEGQPYPLVEVLNEARSACEPRGLPAITDQTAFNNWARFNPDSNGWLAEYVARNSEGDGAMQVTPLTFTKTIAGRNLVAFVARLRFSFAPEIAAFSCEIFDPDAPSITVRALTTWARRSPKRSSGADGKFVFATWEPGIGRGIDETTVVSMSSGRAPASATTHPGLRYSAISTSSRRSR